MTTSFDEAWAEEVTGVLEARYTISYRHTNSHGNIEIVFKEPIQVDQDMVVDVFIKPTRPINFVNLKITALPDGNL